MGYIEKHLLSGEQLIYRTRLHSVAVLFPLCMGLLLAIGGVVCFYFATANRGMQDQDPKLWAGGGLALIVFAAITVAVALTRRNATQMAVTNRRVLIKTGLLSRRTVELLLSQVESIVINEPFFGRMLGYGSIVVHGTGGTPETFHLIANPMEFRRHVQEQIEASQTQRRMSGTPQN